uniref:PRELI/MSF1 domain-containing protein n=1 Tax=Romanomermis culicivorax TaxID=13658 RepID=A0A915K5J9_ROMCU
MVQTYQSPVRIYKYPFELVMAAYERRFPTSPLIPIFVGSEISEEFKSEDGAVHVIERKCKLNVDAPYLLKKIAGVEYVYFMQKNSLNRRNRTLTIDAHNLSFSSRIVIKESCVYYVHQENPDWTCFEQSASLDVKSFFGFESTVEKIAMKQYEANIQKMAVVDIHRDIYVTQGKEIIEHYVSELFKEGKTHFPLFEETVSTISDDSAIFMSKSHEAVRKLSKDQKEPTPEITILQSSRSGSMAARRLSSPGAAVEEGESGKLETEYIKRFLGVLTPLEESRLCELRYWLHDNCKGKIPNDAHLLRFLRARDFDVNRAREMVTSSMLWRKQHNVDKILSTYQPHPVVLQYFPGAWLGHDLIPEFPATVKAVKVRKKEVIPGKPGKAREFRSGLS